LNHIGPMHIAAYFPILHCPLILTINIHPYHFPVPQFWLGGCEDEP
jgi:hypothetical protein